MGSPASKDLSKRVKSNLDVYASKITLKNTCTTILLFYSFTEIFTLLTFLNSIDGFFN
jgi:hypothetical protein